MTDEQASPEQLRRLLDAVLLVASDLELELVLRRLTQTAVDLVDASYGALGVLDPTRAHLSDFITVGLDPWTEAEIGERPRGHGILGLLIVDPKPLRLPDLAAHPDSYGFPPNHPPMTSFLGVPVLVQGEAFGNLYLTDKHGGGAFTQVDEDLAVALAGAAGTAIEKARLHARVRELAVIEDRERIARDLHDTVIQRLFATGLSLQGAVRLAAANPDLVDRIQQAIDELDFVVRQVRSSIFELHATDLSAEGLRRRLLAVGDELADALGFSPTFQFDGPIDTAVPDEVGSELVAVVAEALSNVARHAASPTALVQVTVGGGRLSVTVDDEGRGPGERRVGGRGIDNMAARAAALRGACTLDPRSGGGTRVTWSVPLTA